LTKSYEVHYKSGRKKTVTGNVTLFSSSHFSTNIPKLQNLVYLNADEIESITEITEDTGKEV